MNTATTHPNHPEAAGASFDRALLAQLRGFAQRHTERYEALLDTPDADPRALLAESRLLAAAVRTYQQQVRHVQRAEAPKRAQRIAEPPAEADFDAESQPESDELRQARWSAELARRTGFIHADRLAERVAELEHEQQRATG